MSWKKDAQERLNRYEAFCMAYRNIPLEIKRLEMEIQSARTVKFDHVSGEGIGRGEDRLLNNIALRKRLQWSFEQTKRWLDVTNHALEALNRDDRKLLQRVHVNQEQESVERISEELGVERSSVYRRLDRILGKFALALYGPDENFPTLFS